MSSVQGYGIIDENIIWVNDASAVLYDEISQRNSFLKNLIDEYAPNCDNADFADVFDMFCDQYENPLYGWHGFEGVVTDFIDEQAFDGRELLRYEDGCFYVDAADALQARISTEEIKEKLQDSFSPFCQNEELTIEWYEIRL